MSRELIERLWSRGRDFLGVEYPILGGAMTWISESTLVSAISNAGAFGVLAGGNMPPDMLKTEIKKTRDKTDKPFGINLITIAPNFAKHLEHVMKIEFPFVILAGGLPPREAINRIRETKSKLLCFAPTVGIAQNLVKGGVDALIIEGHEAGGRPVGRRRLLAVEAPKRGDELVAAAPGVADSQSAGELVVPFRDEREVGLPVLEAGHDRIDVARVGDAGFEEQEIPLGLGPPVAAVAIRRIGRSDAAHEVDQRGDRRGACYS